MSKDQERLQHDPDLREQARIRAEQAHAKVDQARADAEQSSMTAAARPQDEFSIRAKSSGHKKKTADKWNQ